MGDLPSTQVTDIGSTTVLVKAVELLGRVVAPTTLTIALLLYFGWVRTTTLYWSLGIHYGVLGLASQDYVLSSITVVIDFLKWILIALLAIVWVHYGLGWFLQWQKRWRGGIAILFCVAGLGLLWTSYSQMALDGVARNLIWTAGVGLTSYGLWLAGSMPLHRDSAETLATRAAQRWPAFRYLNRLLIIGLVIVGLFVTVAWYADAEGRRSAQAIIACPTQRPAATVYSRDPLTMEVAGVTSTKITDDKEAYRYRYTGLRFLIRSNQKYFFIPEAMSPADPVTIILPDDSAIRVELTPGTRCTAP